MKRAKQFIGKTLSNLTEREQFIILVDNDRIKKSDAIILLEGDGFFRAKKAKELWEKGLAPIIVISGNSDNPLYGSFVASSIAKELEKMGVDEQYIMLEKKSKNTRQQGIEVMKLVKEKKWQSIILVGSHYHQYRAFLTFLHAMEESAQRISIFNASANYLAWFENNPWGTRFELLQKEFKKIESYASKEHITSYADAIAYQKWKEQKQ